MNFGQTIEQLKFGKKVARVGWNGKNQWVALQVPDEHSKMKRPYFYIHPVDGNLVPWVPSVSDCLSDDWTVVTD